MIYNFRGIHVTPREIEVHECLTIMKAAHYDELEALLDCKMPLDAILLSTKLTREDLVEEGVLPSDLENLFNEVVKANPHLAGLYKRMTDGLAKKS